MDVGAPRARRRVRGEPGVRRNRRALVVEGFEPLEGRALTSVGLTPGRRLHEGSGAGAAEVSGLSAPGRRVGGSAGVRAMLNLSYTPGQHLDLYLPAGHAPPG